MVAARVVGKGVERGAERVVARVVAARAMVARVAVETGEERVVEREDRSTAAGRSRQSPVRTHTPVHRAPRPLFQARL